VAPLAPLISSEPEVFMQQLEDWGFEVMQAVQDYATEIDEHKIGVAAVVLVALWFLSRR
jgi:hypothetical protein